jgi:hypothetical protein
MAKVKVGGYEYDSRTPDYIAPPGSPPVAAAPQSAYANELQEARAKALAQIMMGYEYRAVQGDNDDKKFWQFSAQHDDARNLLGKSRVLADDRLTGSQRQRGLGSGDPRSGYVLHDLVEKAFGNNFQRGDYDDTDARGDWLARKIPGAIRSVGPGALAQALADSGVEPGEGQQSMGQNYIKGALKFLAENRSAMDPGIGNEQDNLGGVSYNGVPLGDVANTMVNGGYLGVQPGGGTITGLGGYTGAEGGKIGGFRDLADALGRVPGGILSLPSFLGTVGEAWDGAVNDYNPFGFGDDGYADPGGPEMGAPF